jgi:hypothetical protein
VRKTDISTLAEALNAAGFPPALETIGRLFVCRFLTENDDVVDVKQGGKKFHQNEIVSTIIGLEFNQRLDELVITPATKTTGIDELERIIFHLSTKKWELDLFVVREGEEFNMELNAEFELL